MSIRGQRRGFVFLAVLLLAASGGARAEEEPLYKWMDENGQIHFTATPPPRNARPIAKAQDKGPIQIVTTPKAPTKARRAPGFVQPHESLRTAPPATSAAQAGGTECSRYAGPVGRLDEAKREVGRLEGRVEKLERSDYREPSKLCSYNASAQFNCESSTFDREQELAEAREKLDTAQDQLADAEQAMRLAEVPRECMSKD